MSESLLKGSFDKVGWARRHVEKLDTLIDREIRPRTHELRYEYDADSRHLQLAWDQPPITDPQYGLRIGDAVQQFRSALDLAVWELTALEGNDPESQTGPKPQFPIVSDQGDWNSWAEGQFRGVGSNPKRVIREHQPCFRSDRPDIDQLTFLADLSNQDKHRVITPIQAAVDINQDAIEQFIAGHIGLIEQSYFMTPVGMLFKPRQDIVRLHTAPNAEMKLEVDSSGDVALWQGALVIPALDAIGGRVEGVLRELVDAAS